MNEPTSSTDADRRSPEPRLRGVAVAVLLGAVFVVASLLAALLPALAVAYLVTGFAIRDVVVVLALWAASASLTVATFLLISRTYAERVLRRRLIGALPFIGPED